MFEKILGFFNLQNDLRMQKIAGEYQKKLRKLYCEKKYSTIPFIPDEKESLRILESYTGFPFVLVPKEYMNSLSENKNIIRGDIVLLWWLQNPRTKLPFPLYFIFTYGINPQIELSILKKCGYLKTDDLTLTVEGKKILAKYHQFIREHKAAKSMNRFGKIEYIFSDTDSVKNKSKFISTKDIIEDINIGLGYEKLKDYDNALLAYNSAFELAKKSKDSTIPPGIFMRQAIIYRKLKRYDEEVSIIRKGIEFGTTQTKTTTNKLKLRLPKAEALLNKK